MANHDTMLHMFCGKIAAGKSTLAARLAEPPNTIMFSEDRLLAVLYPEEIRTLADYARCADRLRSAIGPLIIDLLRSGTSVVLDFQANTLAVRAWLLGLIEAAEVGHRLHFLEASDETCKQRLEARNADGRHQYQVSEADFELFTSYFVPPESTEGFNIIRHGQDRAD